jgi:flagellar protein FliL
MAKDEQTPAETEGGSKKKMFIIIGAGVAVALILGIVAFMLLGKGDKKDAGKEGTKTEAKAEGGHGAAPAEGGHGGKEGAAGASNMYPLEPFIVNIYDGQELRYLKVKVEMEMAGATKGDLDARLAPMRDAVLVLLSSKTLHDIQDVQGKNQLKDEILVAINKIITPGKISKVYFTDFVVQ